MSTKEVYNVIKIDDTSWRIEDGPVRVFLFVGSDKALLVDSGYGSGDLRKTVAALTTLPVMLVNTHADYDHIGCNSQFERAFMHPSEFARYRQELSRYYSSADGNLAVSPLWEGDIIDLGGRSFEVILTPGHTPGSISLLDEKNGILLGGDGILDDKIAMCDTWRDIEAYVLSLEKLINMRNRFQKVYPPHGSFPIKPDILEGLISGIKRVKNGEIKGEHTDFIENAKMYDVGVAKFLF